SIHVVSSNTRIYTAGSTISILPYTPNCQLFLNQTHTHTQTDTHARTHTRTHAQTDTHARTLAQTHTHARTNTQTDTHTRRGALGACCMLLLCVCVCVLRGDTLYCRKRVKI